MDFKAYMYELAYKLFQAEEDLVSRPFESQEEMELEYAYQAELRREKKIILKMDSEDNEMFLNVDRYYHELRSSNFKLTDYDLLLSFEMGHF
jgi:hypothetical protein